MRVHDLRLFILILEIIIFLSTYIPIALYTKKNNHKHLLIQHLDIAYSVLWFITGFIWGMTLISILSIFIK